MQSTLKTKAENTNVLLRPTHRHIMLVLDNFEEYFHFNLYHIQGGFPIGWEYSAIIFMGVNMVLLVVIAYLYLVLFISIWRTQKLTPLGVFDYEFAVR